jgi:flavin-dependent dehydrogenase
MNERSKDTLHVLIVGGGPAGCSCALTLVSLAQQLGRRVKVTLFEHKQFGRHYNQCMGVLSPPILQLMKECLGLDLPFELVQRRIDGYYLHTDKRSILLKDLSAGDPEPSLVTRRAQLDKFFLDQVRRVGVKVHKNLVTDLEFTGDKVNLYTESGSFKGDVVVGAFGLGRRMGSVLAKRVGYRSPDYLETVVTKIHPGHDRIQDFGQQIHAFLPGNPDIEFGAMVPKSNYITALVTGRRVTAETLNEFIESPKAKGVLRFPFWIDDIFKGTFPISPAGRFYGDRYITIGDSAGLVRPFKGKGVNSAILTGHYAAKIILERGITSEALSRIEEDCRELIGDLWYGRTVRHLTIWLSRLSLFDPVLAAAEKNSNLKQALFDSVSGQDLFHNIVHRIVKSPSIYSALACSFYSHLTGRANLPNKPPEP